MSSEPPFDATKQEAKSATTRPVPQGAAADGLLVPTSADAATSVSPGHRRGPITAKTFLSACQSHFRNYSNPVYHLRKMREDFHSSWGALRNWDVNQVRGDRKVLATTLRGKLYATFVLSGGFSFTGAIVSGVVQAITGNPWLALVVMIAVGHFVATVAYQTIWYLSNRPLYQNHPGGPFGVFMELQRDVLPVQWKGMKLAATLALVSIPVNSLAILFFTLLRIERWVPVPIMVIIVETMLITGTFIRAMGDIFEAHSHILAAKYVREPDALAANA